MNPSESRVLIPPRPNPGPEPWEETRPWSAELPILGAAIVLAIAVIGAGWRLRRLRARGRQVSPASGSTDASTGAPPSRRERLIALSREVREILVARFGPSWRSKTTEEIARESNLADAFGPEDAARLIRFLQEADRAKFAQEGEPPSSPSPDPEGGWVEQFLRSAAVDPERSPRDGGRGRKSAPGR